MSEPIGDLLSVEKANRGESPKLTRAEFTACRELALALEELELHKRHKREILRFAEKAEVDLHHVAEVMVSVRLLGLDAETVARLLAKAGVGAEDIGFLVKEMGCG